MSRELLQNWFDQVDYRAARIEGLFRKRVVNHAVEIATPLSVLESYLRNSEGYSLSEMEKILGEDDELWAALLINNHPKEIKNEASSSD